MNLPNRFIEAFEAEILPRATEVEGNNYTAPPTFGTTTTIISAPWRYRATALAVSISQSSISQKLTHSKMPPNSSRRPQGQRHFDRNNNTLAFRPRPPPQHPVLGRLQRGENVKTYENHTIENTGIREVVLRDHCLVRRVEVDTSIANNCQFVYSTLRGINKLHRCVLFDCLVGSRTTLNHCQVITATLGFRRFPVEIRVLIFLKAIDWKGTTPPLVIALRGDPQLYREALEQLYKNNWFTYSWKNFDPRKFAAMNFEQRIEHMSCKSQNAFESIMNLAVT